MTNATAMIAKLKPNPFSCVSIRHCAGQCSELRVWSVTRSRGAVTWNLARDKRADFDRICDIAVRGSSPDQSASSLSLDDFVTLAALGLWAAEPDLIEPILLEVPIRAAATTAMDPLRVDCLRLRGEVWLQQGGAPSPPIETAPLSCLSPARPILWHRASPVEPAFPWWPDASCLAAIEAVGQGMSVPQDLWPALRALAEHGILAPSGNPEAAGEIHHQRDLKAGRAAFARDGFVDLGQLLPPGQKAAFQTYWRQLAALNAFPERGDKRHGSHGEPSATLLLQLIEPLAEHLIGAPIEPAFSYSWVYDHGTEMPAHRDRMESRYTVSFLLDYQPAPEGPIPWPLVIRPRGRSSPVELHQSVGDALLFCGEELEHSRPAMTIGERSITLLLHYVDRGFSDAMF